MHCFPDLFDRISNYGVILAVHYDKSLFYWTLVNAVFASFYFITCTISCRFK